MAGTEAILIPRRFRCNASTVLFAAAPPPFHLFVTEPAGERPLGQSRSLNVRSVRVQRAWRAESASAQVPLAPGIKDDRTQPMGKLTRS